MRKLCYALAALATLAIAVPTTASAGGFGVYVGGDRDYYGDRYYGVPASGSMNTIAACIADGITATIMAIEAS